jgi:hypothetical protein
VQNNVAAMTNLTYGLAGAKEAVPRARGDGAASPVWDVGGG